MTRGKMTVMPVVVIALIAPGVVSCAAADAAGYSSTPVIPGTPSVSVSKTGPDPQAQAQAQAWLDAASLPPGATPSRVDPARSNSYIHWVCQPVAELEGYWTIPGTTVAAASNWLMSNPTADLVTTAVGPIPDDQDIDGATVGYIPADGTYQGIVYTVAKMNDGVTIRAEVAAVTDSAVCEPPPEGGTWGLPGQG